MTESLLTLENITVQRGERTVLSRLDFSLNRGDRIMIRGENGCGKTTLLKAAARLIPLSGGKITYRGKTMGWVPQEGVLNRFPIASREVVTIGTAARRFTGGDRKKRVDAMMELTGCAHLADRCFHHLSGGEKQRVSLARCLCQGAELLLLDEPASYLDRESRLNLETLLRTVQGETGAALLLVTHEHQLFNEKAWTVLTMEGGRLCWNS